MVFKQLLQASSIDVAQIDSCRLAGPNEILAVLLMAKKFGIPVCPHAGGVGLCEYVVHLSLIDCACPILLYTPLPVITANLTPHPLRARP